MARIVVIGGSVAGLATALACGGRGHEVVLVERDPNPVPDDVETANRSWHRPRVPQAVHSHAFGSLGTNILRDRAPHVYRGMVEAGAAEIALAERKPPTLDDSSPKPGDDELRMLGSRRPTFELVLRRAALATPGVRVRTGTSVQGLEVTNGRVTGVRTDDGQVVPGDLVVNAAGRRASSSRWLSDAGLPVGDIERSSCDITYYTRFYRALTPRPAGILNRGFGAGGLWDHYTATLFLGDNSTFSISLGVLPDDGPMKKLRKEAAFTAAIRATPLLAPWLDAEASEPLSDVYAMGGLDNSLVASAVSPELSVPGLCYVGDSVCTTNPAYGRGVSLALANAYRLAEVLDEYPSVGVEQAKALAVSNADLFTPWYHDAVANDRGRAGLWRATVTGQSPQQPPAGTVTFGQIAAASAVDSLTWHRLIRVMMSLDPPQTVYGDHEVREHVVRALSSGKVPSMPAPDRAQFHRIVAAA